MRLQKADRPSTECAWLVIDSDHVADWAADLQRLGWTESARVLRPTDNNETLVLFKPAQD